MKHWFTLPNIKCRGQYEVDLLAVDTTSPQRLRRYHVECGVSISGSYSKLTDKPFSTAELKDRVKQAGQRRTIGYFIHRKFELPQVVAQLRKYGFTPSNYKRLIVTWGATPQAQRLAEKHPVQLWDFRNILREIAAANKNQRTYFTDDAARTIQLFSMATGDRKPTALSSRPSARPKNRQSRSARIQERK